MVLKDKWSSPEESTWKDDPVGRNFRETFNITFGEFCLVCTALQNRVCRTNNSGKHYCKDVQETERVDIVM